jgi:hypothetical protein
MEARHIAAAALAAAANRRTVGMTQRSEKIWF